VPPALIYESDLGVIELAEEVVTHFRRHRQKRLWSREAGGQLFGSIEPGRIVVKIATGPRRRDRRGRWFYWPQREVEQAEITHQFAKGLHYLGDWHTHDQKRPAPSVADVEKMTAIFRDSKHNLRAMLSVIVGTEHFPEGIWLGLVDSVQVRSLQPAGR